MSTIMVAMKSRSAKKAKKRDVAGNGKDATEQDDRTPDSATPDALRGMKSRLSFFLSMFSSVDLTTGALMCFRCVFLEC